MAQVKKLQGGGTSTPNTQTTPKKRVYNGVELTDVDLDKIVNDTAEFISKNSNYSEDIRGISELSNRLKEEFKKGNMPEFDPTGTGVKIGDINITAGKHNQNIFGNFSGDKLGREFAFRLKEGFDSYTKPSEGSQTTVNTVTEPISKKHSDLSKTISDRYFGGNWENAQKGIGELTTDKRLAYVKQGLKDSISGYKTDYNEDSKYANRLAEIDAATPERIKEIAYEMGMDATDYLEGSAEQREAAKAKIEQNDPYAELRKSGTVIEDDYLASRNYVAHTDAQGFTKLIDKNTGKFIETAPDTITREGQYYGKGIFYNPTKGFKWGDRNEFKLNTDYYSIAEPEYARLETAGREDIDKKRVSIDFTKQFSPIFSPLQKNGKFEYNDISDQFSGLSSGNQRLIIPKEDLKYTTIGDIDLNDTLGYIFDKTANTNKRVRIKLNYNGESTATAGDGTVYNLGVLGKDFGTKTPFTESFYNGLNQTTGAINVDENRLIGRVTGFNNKTITPQNFPEFINKIIRQDFTDRLDGNEAKNLRNIILKYYNDPKMKVQFNQASIPALEALLDKLNTVSELESKSEFYKLPNQQNQTKTNAQVRSQTTARAGHYKNGGILKYQAGGGVKFVPQAAKKVAKQNAPNLGYGSARIGDVGTFSTADTFDAIAIGADVASLAGGAVGIGAGLVGTGAQLIGDIAGKRGVSTTLSNALINLGFTAMAAIPGLAALKMAKGAKNVGKLAKNINEIKRAEKLLEVAKKSNIDDVSKLAGELQDKIKVVKKVAGENPNAASKLVQSISNSKTANWIAPKVQGGLVVGGLMNGYSGLSNAIEDGGNMRLSDLRSITSGAAALKGLGSMAKNQLVKSGTTKLSEIKAEPYKVKTKDGEIIELQNTPKNVGDAEKQVKAHYDSKILKIKEEIKTVDPVDTKRINELEESIKNLETKKTDAKVGNFLGYKSGKLLVDDLKSKVKIKTQSKNWDDRRLKTDDEITGWSSRVGQRLAKKAGYSNEGFTVQGSNLINKMYEKPFTTQKKAIDKLNSEKADESVEELRTLNKNLLSELKKNRPTKPVKEIVKPKRKYTKKEKAKVEVKPEIKKMLALPAGKFYNAKQKLGMSLNSNNMYEMSGKPKSDIYGQLSMFKQGGQLIPKFQNDGILPTPKRSTFLSNGQYAPILDTSKFIAPKTDYSLLGEKKLDPVTQAGINAKARIDAGVSNFKVPSAIETRGDTTYISGQTIRGKSKYIVVPQKLDIKLPITKITGKGDDSSQGVSQETKETDFSPYKKRGIPFRADTLMEGAKLWDALATNKKVAEQLRSVKPVLAQMPSEVYKPVVTNLANENFVNNQVNSYLHQANKPMTSDASLQKATQLEAMSKTTPMTIQARAANTDMYNQTLGASKDSAEKYSIMRNEVANANSERIGAYEARLAQIGATQSAMNKESRAAFMDEMIRNQKEKAIREFGVKNQLEMNKLQNEYSKGLTPLQNKYNNFDVKKSTAYKNFMDTQLNAYDQDLIERNWRNYKVNGKLGTDLANEEKANLYKDVENYSNTQLPFYQEKMLNLQGRDPYSRSYSFGTYKQGGSIDAKVEIQNLKNKMKAKEINAKSSDKAKDRDQKAVAAILKSMSKESLFLLKTMLGK